MSHQPNLGWVFYREAFEVPSWEWFAEKYDDLNKKQKQERASFTKGILDKLSTQSQFKNNKDFNDSRVKQFLPPGDPHKFPLTTIYPGLLIGSGYNHEAGLHGELSLGFFFDHTTGLPVIPGSSVKGVLRSVFPGSTKDGKVRDQLHEFARHFLTLMYLEEAGKNEDDDEAYKEAEAKAQEINIEQLEKDIFEGEIQVKNANGETETRHRSMYQRDIFYDAFILKSEHKPPGSDQADHRILDNDYITPHKHSKNPKLDHFTDPTPIQFLKVLPGVTFCFQFKLHDSYIDGRTFTAGQKKSLFRQILLNEGVGAKTNVGYGQFDSPYLTNESKGVGEGEEPVEEKPPPFDLPIREGDEGLAVSLGNDPQKPKNVKLKLIVKDQDKDYTISQKYAAGIDEGNYCKVKIKSYNKKKDIIESIHIKPL